MPADNMKTAGRMSSSCFRATACAQTFRRAQRIWPAITPPSVGGHGVVLRAAWTDSPRALAGAQVSSVVGQDLLKEGTGYFPQVYGTLDDFEGASISVCAAVGKGALQSNPPRMVELRWGSGPFKVALVGKVRPFGCEWAGTTHVYRVCALTRVASTSNLARACGLPSNPMRTHQAVPLSRLMKKDMAGAAQVCPLCSVSVGITMCR